MYYNYSAYDTFLMPQQCCGVHMVPLNVLCRNLVVLYACCSKSNVYCVLSQNQTTRMMRLLRGFFSEIRHVRVIVDKTLALSLLVALL